MSSTMRTRILSAMWIASSAFVTVEMGGSGFVPGAFDGRGTREDRSRPSGRGAGESLRVGWTLRLAIGILLGQDRLDDLWRQDAVLIDQGLQDHARGRVERWHDGVRRRGSINVVLG